MKKPEEMTDAELRAACGIPLDCPDAVVIAMLRGDADRWSRQGIEAVQAAAREQAGWNTRPEGGGPAGHAPTTGQPVEAGRGQLDA